MERWRRNFFAVWPSMFATSTGLMAVIPMLPLYIEQRFGIDDPEQVGYWTGIAYGVAPLAAACLGPVWGGLGDRVGRRPMVLRANLAIAVCTALMPLAESPAVLALLRMLQGMFAGYVAPAMALVSSDAPRERQGRTIGGLQVGMAMGLFLGPVLGAEVTAIWGRSAVFWFTSILAFLATIPVLLFAREDPRSARGEASLAFVPELVERSRHLLRNRVFAVLLLLVFLMRYGQHMLEPFVALFVRELGALEWIAARTDDPVHALDRTVALAFVVLAAAQFFFTPVWGRLADRFGPLRCLAVVALCLGCVLLATSFVDGIGQYLLLRSFAACFMAGSMTLAYAAATRRVVAARRALAFAMVQSCMQFGLALGPISGAFLAAWAGGDGDPDLRFLFRAAGVCMFLAAVGMVWLRRQPVLRLPGRVPPIPDERQ